MRLQAASTLRHDGPTVMVMLTGKNNRGVRGHFERLLSDEHIERLKHELIKSIDDERQREQEKRKQHEEEKQEEPPPPPPSPFARTSKRARLRGKKLIATHLTTALPSKFYAQA